jgi:glycosyltransferase involved in cell wall biosynthesis
VKVSIVVPAFNEEKLLAQSLRAMKRACAVFAELGWETEIVVCNNNSTDRTGEIASAEGAQVVFEPVNQIGRARNTGARAATGDWLIFVDADSEPQPELFREVAACIQSGKVLAGGATVRVEVRGRVARWICQSWNWLSRWQRWAAGSFIFCSAEAFRTIGGFSETLYASEEIDLSKRLKKLARQRGMRMEILHRHPLATSARKMDLYSPREHAGFLLKTILRGGRTLRSREACPIWYDGRR